MANTGFLIRFIDIGLIVLFGFVMISDIEELSQVELASAAAQEVQQPEPDADIKFVTVAISEYGSFDIYDGHTGDALATDMSQPPELELLLREIRDRNSTDDLSTVVLIRPHQLSTVQRTVDVMDVCERLSIPKSLLTDLERAGDPDAA